MISKYFLGPVIYYCSLLILVFDLQKVLVLIDSFLFCMYGFAVVSLWYTSDRCIFLEYKDAGFHFLLLVLMFWPLLVSLLFIVH